MSAEDDRTAMMAFSYRGASASLPSLRSDAQRWLAEHGILGPPAFDCLLVLNELATNAVQAAPGEPLQVHLALTPAGEHDTLVVAVTNRSTDTTNGLADPEDWAFPTATSPTGRGFAIVRALSDKATAQAGGDTLTVAASMTVPRVV